MTLYSDAKQKIENITTTINGLLDGSFPLSAGKEALQKLQKVFDDLGKSLDRAQRVQSNDSIEQFANLVSTKIYKTLPTLGFILRSTNVRNSFELLEPFQVLADDVLQGKPRILMSAEWDYVPFAFPQSLEDLQSFILIGMPASEGNNSLIIPLAGHELGHAIYRNRSLGGAISYTLQMHCEQLYQDNMPELKRHHPEYDPGDLVAKELLPEAIETSLIYANLQAEELFADMFAYAIFGESFLRSFAYLLAPGNGRGPSGKYPTYRTRIETIRDIGKNEGVGLPGMKDLNLADEPHRGNARERFVTSIAESSVQRIIGALWNSVKDLIEAKNVVRPDHIRANGHLKEFRLGVPAHNPMCLGDIVNAGWMHHLQTQVDNISQTEKTLRFANLNEIVFKTIEVFEYKRRIADGA